LSRRRIRVTLFLSSGEGWTAATGSPHIGPPTGAMARLAIELPRSSRGAGLDMVRSDL